MEAEDNDGDTEDLWVTLNTMGYNKNLQLDEVNVFLHHLHYLIDRYSFFLFTVERIQLIIKESQWKSTHDMNPDCYLCFALHVVILAVSILFCPAECSTSTIMII